MTLEHAPTGRAMRDETGSGLTEQTGMDGAAERRGEMGEMREMAQRGAMKRPGAMGEAQEAMERMGRTHPSRPSPIKSRFIGERDDAPFIPRASLGSVRIWFQVVFAVLFVGLSSVSTMKGVWAIESQLRNNGNYATLGIGTALGFLLIVGLFISQAVYSDRNVGLYSLSLMIDIGFTLYLLNPMMQEAFGRLFPPTGDSPNRFGYEAAAFLLAGIISYVSSYVPEQVFFGKRRQSLWTMFRGTA